MATSDYTESQGNESTKTRLERLLTELHGDLEDVIGAAATSGTPTHEIAGNLGVSPNWVRSWLKSHGYAHVERWEKSS